MSEGITDIEWSVYGKILQITKTNEDIQFKYDASGNRVEKIVKPKVLGLEQSQEYWVYTYYMRDAQGNVMAVYNRNIGIASGQVTDQLFLQETSIYGSSRLGLADQSTERSAFTPGTLSSFVSYNLDGTINRTGSSALTTGTYIPHNTLGFKRYELSNHLGNVNVVIADRKIAVDDGSFTASGIVDRYLPDVLSAQDYYAFGAPMPGRSYVVSTSYRYGFNGKEDDHEIKGNGNSLDFGARIYDPRLGRFLSTDPDASSYPFMTPHCYAGNNPLFYIDHEGKGPIPYGTIILEAFKLYLQLTEQTAVLSLTVGAKGGIISPSSTNKYSLGLALDSYGNYAITSSYSSFVDVFGHGVSVQAEKTGVENKQWYLGNSVGGSVDVGIYNFGHVEGLKGKATNLDIDISLGEKISFSQVYDIKTEKWLGGTVSLGAGIGAGLGMNTNNSTVFAFSEIDATVATATSVGMIAKYEGLILSANPLTNYSLEFKYENDGKKMTGDYIIWQTMTIVNKDGSTSTITTQYDKARAFEFTKPDSKSDYWKTNQVIDATR